jgi:hypothetical protein
VDADYTRVGARTLSLTFQEAKVSEVGAACTSCIQLDPQRLMKSACFLPLRLYHENLVSKRSEL